MVKEFNPETGTWVHVPSPTKGIVTSIPSSMLEVDMCTNAQGVVLQHGEVYPDYGYVEYPISGLTKANHLDGSVMLLYDFVRLSGVSYFLAITTTNIYLFNTTTGTWDNITPGLELSDCETAWTDETYITSSTSTVVKLKGSKALYITVGANFTTGLACYETYGSSTYDISGYTHLHLWMRSSLATAAGDYKIRISDAVDGGTGGNYEDLDVPALAQNEWTAVSLEIGTPANYSDLRSLAFVVGTDLGTPQIRIDDIRAIKAYTGTNDNIISHCVMNDYFIFTNGIDQPQKYDGTTVSDLVTTIPGGSITTAEVVFSFKDHLCLCNNTEAGVDAPIRVSWSSIGEIENFSSGTAGYQDLTDDESWIITALQRAENEYVIYKEKSIVKMEWVGGHTPFRLTTMVPNVSILGKNCVLNIDGVHVIAGLDFLYLYNGSDTVQRAPQVIDTYLYSIINPTYFNRSFMSFDKELSEVQLWIPTSADTPDDVWCAFFPGFNWYRRFKAATSLGEFTNTSATTIGDLVGTIGEQNFMIGSQLLRSNAINVALGTSDGKTYKLSSGTLDNDDTAIESTFETPDFVLPKTEMYLDKTMRVPQIVFEAYGQSVTVEYSTDSGTTFSACQGGGTNTVTLSSVYTTYQLDFDVTTDKIRFRFSNVSSASAFWLRYYGFYYILRSKRR